MKRLKDFAQTLLGLAFIAAIGVGLWLLIKSLFANAAVAGPVIAASVAIVVFAAGEYFTRQRIAQQYRWDKVADTYVEFLRLIRKINKDETPSDIEEFVARFHDELILWGAPGVITAWVEMARQSEQGFTDEEATERYRDLLRAIRKDLGQRDRKLDDRDLVRLLISDVDEHFESGLVSKPGRGTS